LVRVAHDQKALDAESSLWRRVRNWWFERFGWLAEQLI